MNKNKDCDCLVVSISYSHGIDAGVLVVGRKTEGEGFDIVNAFQGQEAWDLYQKLITRKEK